MSPHAKHPVLSVTQIAERSYDIMFTAMCCCRFLQGADTDEQAVKDIRHAIQEASETTVRLLNYKKSGQAFWNMFTLAPMADVDGTARFLIGVQVDVTAVEEALPQSLKATNAGPQVPKRAANAISAGQGKHRWLTNTVSAFAKQQLSFALHCIQSNCTLDTFP